MADKYISSLTAGAALDGTELFESEQAAASVKLTADQIAARVLAYLAAQDLTVQNLVCTSLRINASGGVPPPTGSTLSATDYVGNNNQVLTNPDQWIAINLNGVPYVIPVYTPGT